MCYGLESQVASCLKEICMDNCAHVSYGWVMMVAASNHPFGPMFAM